MRNQEKPGDFVSNLKRDLTRPNPKTHNLSQENKENEKLNLIDKQTWVKAMDHTTR